MYVCVYIYIYIHIYIYICVCTCIHIYVCNTPLFQKQKPNPLPLISSANSTLPSVSLSLILAAISPPLLLDQVLERKPHLSLLLPPLIASLLLGKSPLWFKVQFRNSTRIPASIQSLTKCSSFLCGWMMNSSRSD